MNESKWTKDFGCGAKTVDLERMEYEAQVRLDNQLVEALRSRGKESVILDRARNQLAMSLRVAVYGKQHPDKHVVRYPADWWEAAKDRFAPAWFTDKYPIKFICITAGLKELYPEIQPAIPDESPVLRVEIREQPEYYYT